MPTLETKKVNARAKSGYFPVQVWKCILDIADGVVRGMPHALIPMHTQAHLDSYMIRLADNGQEILVVRDGGRLDRDACEHKINLLEDRLSQLSVGENPMIVDPNTRWHDRLVEIGKKRLDDAEEIKKEIRALKAEIKNQEGIKVQTVKLDWFKERDFTLEFEDLRK